MHVQEEEEKERLKEEEERLEKEERARIAKRPRHETLNFNTLAETNSPQEISALSTTMAGVVQLKSRKVGDPDAFAWRDDNKHKAPVQEIREKVEDLKVVSRAKVTMNRIYCAAYHPDVQKDLLFFGGMHSPCYMMLMLTVTLKISTVNWVSGTLELRPRRKRKMVILLQRTRKAESIGAYNNIGRRHQNHQYLASRSTL